MTPAGATSDVRRLLLIGHGRMGKLAERVSAEFGFEVAGVITRSNAGEPRWPDADVAVDFSAAEAVPSTVRRLAERGTPVVIGTTGWGAQESALRDLAARHQIGIVAAANFALGVNLFLALAERAGAIFSTHEEFGAWIHELHHAAKRDAPSGTALALRAAAERGGYAADIHVSSTRAGSIPGTHTLGFDAASETITLTHTARDRSGFARGALQAARWIIGRQGWFSMGDVLGI